MNIGGTLSLASLNIGRTDAALERDQVDEFKWQLESCINGKHAVVIAGDLEGFQTPHLARQAIIAALMDLKALTPGMGLVIVMESPCAYVDEIRAAAYRCSLLLVQITAHQTGRNYHEREARLWLPELPDWYRSGLVSIDHGRKRLILDVVGEAASGKSLLLLPGNPQSNGHVRAARADGFTVIAFEDASASCHAELANDHGLAVCTDGATDGVMFRSVYDSKLAWEIAKYVEGKVTVAFVTSQIADYKDRPAVSKAMTVVAQKLGIKSAVEAKYYAVVCREDANSRRSDSSFLFANDMHCDCLYIYSHDAIRQTDDSDPECHMICTRDFPRGNGGLNVGTVCSEVLGIASQVNEGEKQIMVIFGAALDGVHDALEAAREGHVVIVLEEYGLQQGDERADPDWFDEHALFRRRRAELEAAGVRFFKNADAMPEVRWTRNGLALDDGSAAEVMRV
ncbi:hypothetical protein PAQ31011_01259 [Pandoraea aquatica]|uniref:Uncharacterized protein n=1 Tax=Pandoraea aquatica TaxID=2508290 RepID=A0A5E4T8Y3_9BURK|nr:hypothetical protein [Pandoraea aquatica]VVD83951.1 hypothetical protein PAQ31011_01259 [Pandoraea aquatica]